VKNLELRVTMRFASSL